MFADYKSVKSLNGTDRRLYNYILSHIDEVIDMNIRDFAKANFVSTATVVRFCRALNCDGFADLKKALRNYNDGNTIPNDKKNIDEIIRFFKYADTSEFDEQVDRFTEILMKKKTIVFEGIGQSGSIAEYGARYFSNAGLMSFAITDPFYPNKMQDDSYCFIIISESGETIELIDQVRHYREANETILLITNNPDSTLAELSDDVFAYDVTTALLMPTWNLTSQVPALFIIEQIGKRIKETLID